MCGIVGKVNKNGKNVSKTEISNMLNKIKHRGPDGEGIFLDGNIGCGHVLLKIQDTSSKSKQPFLYKNLVLCFNGEIYNFLELKKELTVHTRGKPESDKFYIFLRGLIPLSKYMVVSKYESYVEENVCSKIEISSKYIKITEEKPINIYSLEVGTESRIYTFYYDDYYNCLQANMEYNINLTVDSDYIYSQYGHKRPYIKGVACYISLKRDLYRGINAPTNYEEPIIGELSKRLNLDVSHDSSFDELVYQNYISLEQARDK